MPNALPQTDRKRQMPVRYIFVSGLRHYGQRADTAHGENMFASGLKSHPHFPSTSTLPILTQLPHLP
jgi:hypothetical protein